MSTNRKAEREARREASRAAWRRLASEGNEADCVQAIRRVVIQEEALGKGPAREAELFALASKRLQHLGWSPAAIDAVVDEEAKQLAGHLASELPSRDEAASAAFAAAAVLRKASRDN
jgi:hypothetical protein